MNTWKEIAEDCRRNYEYAQQELKRICRKPHKNGYDLHRMCVLEQIYFEQKFQYKQCAEIARRHNGKI